MSSRRVWIVTAIAALVLANVAVVLVLVLRTPEGAANGEYVPETPTLDASPEVEPDPSPEVTVETPTPSPTPDEPTVAPVGVPATRQIVAIDAETAWRTTLATCGEPFALERTTDGVTWSEVTAPANALVRLRGYTADEAAITGADDACEPLVLRTWSAGAAWSVQPEALSTTWLLDPADRSRVFGPAATTPVPCPAVGLAGLTVDDGAVLCTTGELVTSNDGGATWAAVATVEFPAGISDVEDGYLVLQRDAACGDNQALVTYDAAGQPVGAPACAPVPTTVDGTIAAAVGESTLWLWTGETVLRSGDGGATWQ